MNNSVSNVYSEALFDILIEKNSLNKGRDDLKNFKNLINENPDIIKVLANPNILKEDKKDLIDKLMGDSIKEISNFIKVLIDKQRFSEFNSIYEHFTKRYYDHENIEKGLVFSARELEAKDIEKIEQSISKKINKKVELENVLDESLIGGFTVKLDGKFIDNSIKGRLSNLSSSLKEKRGEL